MTTPKRPRDTNQLAKVVVDIAVSDAKVDLEASRSDVVRGRAGGLEGGRTRSIRLSAERRSEIAKQGAAARWAETKSKA